MFLIISILWPFCIIKIFYNLIFRSQIISYFSEMNRELFVLHSYNHIFSAWLADTKTYVDISHFLDIWLWFHEGQGYIQRMEIECTPKNMKVHSFNNIWYHFCLIWIYISASRHIIGCSALTIGPSSFDRVFFVRRMAIDAHIVVVSGVW